MGVRVVGAVQVGVRVGLGPWVRVVLGGAGGSEGGFGRCRWV